MAEDETKIGDETFSAPKWLAAHWPALGPWLAIGSVFGGGVVLLIVGAPIAAGQQLPQWLGVLLAAIGPVMLTAGVIGVYIARRGYLKQEEKKRLQHRAERHDELMGVHEQEIVELKKQHDDLVGLREQEIIELKKQHTEAEAREAAARAIIDADQKWSASPFQFLTVSPAKCAVNFDLRTVSLTLNVANRYSKARHVWVSANVAIYRDGGSKPLFTIPLPVVSVDAAANGVTEASHKWPAMMEPSQVAEAKAVYERDRVLRLQLINATVTTVVNLSGDPRTVDSSLGLATPVAAEHVFYE